MRFGFVVGLMLAVATGGLAQRMGGRGAGPRGHVAVGEVPYRTYGSPSGYGNVVFPGTGTPPAFTTSYPFGTGFVEGLGNVIAGVPYTGVRGRFRNRRFLGGGFYGGPLAWPIVVGAPVYDDSYQQQPQTVVVAPPAQQPGQAPVTINQYFGSEQGGSSVQMYRAPSPQAAAGAGGDNQVLFFIALTDSSVYTAVAYWVEDGTLHYITPQGQHNQVSLALVDRGVSARLNAGRAVEFQLPPS